MARSRRELSFGGILVLELHEGERLPAAVQAVLVPQDVNLILGDTQSVESGPATVAEALAEAEVFEPRRPGTVLIGRSTAGRPLLLQAVVYDFERIPPVKESEVFEAMLAAFEEVKRRRLVFLALKPLGTAHGGIAPQGFLRMLAQICYSSVELGTSLTRVLLILDSPADLAGYASLLQRMFP